MSVDMNVHEDTTLAQAVRDLAVEGFKGPGERAFESREKYVWLREAGSKLWLDTGDAEAAENVWSAEVEAMTTNNTLVNQVVQTGSMDGVVSYAARKIRDARPGIAERDLILEIGFLINAKLALSLVEKFGAHVSVELHPDLAFDLEGTVAFARRYRQISPEFFYIKVPMTPVGFVAVRKLSSEGVPVNYTLGFSARQNYLAARFSHPRFVNVFLGRLNALVEDNGIGDPVNVGERAALASDEMIKNIRASLPGAVTEQIGASVRSGGQVATLSGMDVLTVPPKVAGDYLNMDVTKEDTQAQNWRDLKVQIDAAAQERLSKLWEIDGPFVSFVEDAARKGDQVSSGRELVELSREHDVGLFRDWPDVDRRAIREHGKIPDLSQWCDAPVDDLMTISGLESFAKDQVAVDERIARLLREQ